jgi:hypothetical protein
LQGKKCKKFNFFQNQNDTCAHLLVMKFHDRQSSERCIRKLISRHCLDKTRTRWNDLLFLITDDRDFRPQTCPELGNTYYHIICLLQIMLRFLKVEDRTLKRHKSIGVFVVYIDIGSPVLYIPSKSRDLADENNFFLTEW